MIHVGDCIEVMRRLEAGSVQTCVTSPPYFGLRDYGVDGQIGLEVSPEAFVQRLVEVFREVRRLLRDDGTLWLNLGDSYAADRGGTHQPAETLAGGKGGKTEDGARVNRDRHDGYNPTRNARAIGLKHKDLIGIPWRVAFALQADGWYLRQDIIWAKPNPMPESVRDRCTKAHEYLFLLSKSPRYYFDAEAIEEPRSSNGGRGVSGWAAGPGDHSVVAHNRDRGNAKTFRGGQYTHGAKFDNSHATQRGSVGNAPPEKDTRNRRSVWEIPTRPFREAHFATYPEELVEPCVLAGSRAGDVVFDPFMGAGTTAVVASRLGRRWLGSELNPEYARIAEERLRSVQPGLALGAR